MLRTSLPAVTVLALLLSACSTAAPDLPDLSLPAGSDVESLVILGINDFHGALMPQKGKTTEAPGRVPLDYEFGGAAAFASHVKILRQLYGDRLLVLDGGDEWQGTLESNMAEGAPMVEFFNRLEITAAAVGNHEFDFGMPALLKRMSEARYPYLAANIEDKVTGKPVEWPNTKPSILIEAGRLKVGIVGLSTRSTPVTTRSENVATLRFTDLREATLRESAKLRKQGADLVLITAHVGIGCQPDNPKYRIHDRRIWTPKTAQAECVPTDEMTALLSSLPAGTVDAVVSGHSHQIVHHWVAGVPVIQSGSMARYSSVMYLFYDVGAKKLLTDLTRIDSPVPICPKVFERTGDCEGRKPAPADGRGPLVEPRLWGRAAGPDASTLGFLEPVTDRVHEFKVRVVGATAQPLTHDRAKETPMLNLVADSIRAKTGADFGLMNPGGVRIQRLEAGPLTYEDIYRMMPFENTVSVLKVTGRELERILSVANNGARGFFGTSGMIVEVLPLDQGARPRDLDGDGKKLPWEMDRLVSLRTSSGQKVDPDKTYTLATLDFLVKGGDDMGWPMSKVPADRVVLDAGGLAREAIIEYLGKNRPLNTEEKPLVDPKRPRLIFKAK